MTIQEALQKLEALGTEQNRKTYRRHGAGDKVFGVSFAHLGVKGSKGNDFREFHAQRDYINASSQVANIQILNPIKVEFTVPEKYANQVKIGEAIAFTTEGTSERFSGKVYATDNQIDPITRSLKIRASVPNPKGSLKPGAFVKVDFSLKEIGNALMIPTEAIIPILKGQQIFISKDGKAKPVVVEVGVRTDTRIQILNGIQVGDTVITSGLMSMKPETKVKFSTVQ